MVGTVIPFRPIRRPRPSRTPPWLPAYVHDNRSYLTIAIGCTGGQHRSVYVAEQLGARFREHARVLVRHRSFK